MSYDFTRYIFVTDKPEEITPLVGQKIRGMTEDFGYLIESFDGKRKGVVRELREAVDSDQSLRNLTMCLVDFAQE